MNAKTIVAKPVEQMTRPQLESELNQLRQLIVDADFVTRARFFDWGLCDSIDNTGSPYPSQWSADLVRQARMTNPPTERLVRFAG